MMLPTRSILSVGMPSLPRFSSASGDGVQRSSASESVTILLISSGMVLSNDRRPASRWATGMLSFTAVSVAAMVEFTSPTTMTMSGFRARNSSSHTAITFPVCTAWVPLPTPR